MNENEFDQFVDAVAERMNQRGVAGCDPGLNPCANILYSEITVERFYRSGRTTIDEVFQGAVPIVPGQAARIRQAAHPGWLAGCFRLTYRLANNGTNHHDIEIRFFVDGIELDTVMYGSEIYDNANHIIGDGLLPVPLAHGKQCCIGALNRLEVELRHVGAANQLEQPRLFVNHGKAACCSACSAGKECQTGCNHEQPKPPMMPKPVPMLAPAQQGQVIVVKQ